VPRPDICLETADGDQLDYPFPIRPLTEDDRGGYLVEFPDLPGCLSDGETIEEAIANGADALRSWIATARELGDPIPQPLRPAMADTSER
jgi:antitoxin HicB